MHDGDLRVIPPPPPVPAAKIYGMAKGVRARRGERKRETVRGKVRPAPLWAD